MGDENKMSTEQEEKKQAADQMFKKPSEIEREEQGLPPIDNDSDISLPDEPSEDEFDEVMSPGLSPDFFEIGDKSFQFKISNIRTQKQMIKSFDSIMELTKKLDIPAIAQAFNERSRANLEAGTIDNTVSEMIELIQDIVQRGGISNILITLMDLFVGVVCAICQAQDDTVTLDWIEDNLLGFAQAQEIFFEQLDKDAIGGRVIDFLQLATRAVVGTVAV